MHERKKQIIKVILYTVLGAFAIMQIFPFLWMVVFSLKTETEIHTKSPLSLPASPYFQNFVDAWVKGNVSSYFLNSVVVTVISVVMILLLSGMIAYSITRMRWRLKGGVLAVIMTGMMIPIHATLIPLFLIMQKLGLLSTHLSIILPYIATGMPLAVYIFSNFMRNIPRELESAAYIDGCGVVRTYFSIILPTLTPAISTIAIFAFMSTWNEFIMASTYLQNQALNTLPIGLSAFKGKYLTAWGPLGAAIVISTIPLLLFYFVFSEQVEKSFTAGSILK